MTSTTRFRPLFLLLALGTIPVLTGASGDGCSGDETIGSDPDPTVPVTCGTASCAEGEYCCNESCGICAPVGGVCTQQICGKLNLK